MIKKRKSKTTTIPIQFRGKSYVSPKKKPPAKLSGPNNQLEHSKNRVQVRIHETYLSQMPNGHWMKAQVLASRTNPLCGQVQYFVHFEGVDRRLDQWLDISKIDTSVEKNQASFDTMNSNNSNLCESSSNISTNEQKVTDDCSSSHHSHNSEPSSIISSSKSNSSEDPKIGGEDKTKETKKRMTRNMKRLHDDVNHTAVSLDDLDPITARLEKEHTKKTKVKYIDKLIYSSHTATWDIDTWYFSPYPDRKAFYEYFSLDSNNLEKLKTNTSNVSYFNDTSKFYKFPEIYVSGHTLTFFETQQELTQHIEELRSEDRQPPGKMIYIDDIHDNVNNNHNTTRIAVYEIDGMQHKTYCQHLCLLSKLFLDHKTLYFDVAPFIFYVLCELDYNGATMVGYFSKEKDSVDKNNLACIIVLPPFQRQGYGKFIIDLSYKISKMDNKIGSPERPLSDLGNVSYRSYWDYTLLRHLKIGRYGAQSGLSIEDLVDLTGIASFDVTESLLG